MPHAVPVLRTGHPELRPASIGAAPAIQAVVDTPSRRVSLRQGMRVVAVEDRDGMCGRLPTEVWELTASDWRARQG